MFLHDMMSVDMYVICTVDHGRPSNAMKIQYETVIVGGRQSTASSSPVDAAVLLVQGIPFTALVERLRTV